MSDIRSLIADMVRAGVDPDLIGRTAHIISQREPIKVVDDAAERRRKADRERKAEMKILRNSAESAEIHTSPTPLSFPLVPPPTTPPYNPPINSPTPISSPGADAKAFPYEFEGVFWPIYPNKVGKPVALKAFIKARGRADLETIMDGLRTYVGKLDDRPWCNPSTWLNQDRWNDAPAQVDVTQRAKPPPKPSITAAAQRHEDGLKFLNDLLEGKVNVAEDPFDGNTIDHDADYGNYAAG